MYAVVAAVARRSGSGDGGGGSTCCASAMVGIRRAPSMHPKSSSCFVLIAQVVHVGLLPQLWAGWLAAWYPGHVYGRGKHPKEAPWAPWLKKRAKISNFLQSLPLGPKTLQKAGSFPPKNALLHEVLPWYCRFQANPQSWPLCGPFRVDVYGRLLLEQLVLCCRLLAKN